MARKKQLRRRSGSVYRHVYLLLPRFRKITHAHTHCTKNSNRHPCNLSSLSLSTRNVVRKWFIRDGVRNELHLSILCIAENRSHFHLILPSKTQSRDIHMVQDEKNLRFFWEERTSFPSHSFLILHPESTISSVTPKTIIKLHIDIRRCSRAHRLGPPGFKMSY